MKASRAFAKASERLAERRRPFAAARRHRATGGERRRPGPAILGPVTWQWIAVGVIELLAVGYLVHRVVGPRRRPALLEKPDVKASALVRKKRSL